MVDRIVVPRVIFDAVDIFCMFQNRKERITLLAGMLEHENWELGPPVLAFSDFDDSG